MDSLHDVIVTTKVAIELADEALAEAAQTKQSLQTKRNRINAKTNAFLAKYELL